MPTRSGYYFWVDRWRNERALRFVSWEARALWRFVLDEMSQCNPYGHLIINGKPPTPQMIAIIVEMPERIVAKALSELEEHGVFSRTAEGVIYCRFMVKDAGKRIAASEYGKRGGNPALKANGHVPLRVRDKGDDDEGDNGPDKVGGEEGLTPSLKPPSRACSVAPVDAPRSQPSLPQPTSVFAIAQTAGAEPAASQVPPDNPKEQERQKDARSHLWAEMKSMAGGNDPGGFVGRLMGQYDEGLIIKAHFDAVKANPADYRSWMAGTLKARAPKTDEAETFRQKIHRTLMEKTEYDRLHS